MGRDTETDPQWPRMTVIGGTLGARSRGRDVLATIPPQEELTAFARAWGDTVYMGVHGLVVAQHLSRRALHSGFCVVAGTMRVRVECLVRVEGLGAVATAAEPPLPLVTSCLLSVAEDGAQRRPQVFARRRRALMVPGWRASTFMICLMPATTSLR